MANQLEQFGPLDAINYVQQQGEIGRARGQQNRLAELASQSYTAPAEQQNQLLGQMAAISPQAAQATQQQFQGQQRFGQEQEDRRMQKLAGAARYLEQARQTNPQAVQGAWNAVRPMLAREVPEGQFPEQWDDATMAPTLYEVLAKTGGGAQGNVQSVRIGEDGFYYNVFRDGRVVNTGVKSSPNIKVLEQEGQSPFGVVTSGGVPGAVVQLGSGGGTAPQPGAPAAQQQPMPMRPSTQAEDDSYAQRLNAYAQQLKEAGLTNEQIVPLQDAYAQQLDAMLMGGPSGAAPAAVGPIRIPTAAEKAAAEQQAKINTQNANFETQLEQERRLAEVKARAEVEKATAVEAAKAESERRTNERAKTASLNNVDRGLKRINTAMSAIAKGAMFDTGPIDGRVIGPTQEGQELEAAVGAIQNDMLALTRVPGIGSQSDLEARIANLKWPSIYNHPSVNAQNVKQLEAFMTDLRAQLSGAAAAPGPPPAAGGGRTIVRSGTTPDGRRVIQYSDGTTDYGN
ncbi:hypothetical protein [Xanthomonas sp. WHRI 7945]|nr:hypothetical protein [Xanthomonas campestris pv. campestris]